MLISRSQKSGFVLRLNLVTHLTDIAAPVCLNTADERFGLGLGLGFGDL